MEGEGKGRREERKVGRDDLFANGEKDEEMQRDEQNVVIILR